jgi:hypothetical protein
MKLNRLETHDRLEHFKQDQALNIFQGAEDCLKKNRLSIGLQQYSPYIYIFAHPRTAEDGITKRMLWQPRLHRPKMQTNSYLFRAKSNSNELEICWLLPPRETWEQYRTGNVTEHELVNWSINMFCNYRQLCEIPHAEDLSDERSRQIYITVATEIEQEKRMEKLYGRKNIEESFHT